MDSRNAMPYLAAIFLRFVFAGLFIIAKRALELGMSHFTFTVYRNAIAAVVFALLALVFERNPRQREKLSTLGKIFLLALFGVLDQNLSYAGMKHTTASFATILFSFLPIINFLLALLLRLEKVKFKSSHGQAKIIGTFVSVGGVLTATFIKGHVIGLPWTKHKPSSAANYHQNSIWGPLMILGACLFSASYNILQEKTLESYPALLSLTAMISAAASIEGFIASVAFEKGINFTVWSIHWDIKLLAYVYGGILCSGLANYISGYILKEKGSVFLTSFNPLTILIVAGIGCFILAEQLDLGKVVGGFVIVLGLYLVLWGKTKDGHSKTKDGHSSSSVEHTEEVSVNPALGHQALLRVNIHSVPLQNLGAGLGGALSRLISIRNFCAEVKGSFLDKSEVMDRVLNCMKKFQKVDPSKAKKTYLPSSSIKSLF